MGVIQSLDLTLRDEADQELLRQDLTIMAKLARMGGSDSLTGEELITEDQMKSSVGRLVMVDLGLEFDGSAQMPHDRSTGFYNLDLSETSFTPDEQANIYYMYYGINLMKPNYQQGDMVVPGGFIFNGFESYWQRVDDGFINLFFPDAPISDSGVAFADAFHVMAMVYLRINGYDSYKEAEQNQFRVHGAG